ncbi:hypothetical protein BDV36DRAFT_9357 [Aspergillus pseudocaelatus]|uniref:GDP-L-fucose synthase n=1 Tax=Aspergillus pseudocaelatus TaxID=1825620 RepID=A0ABQ6WFR4_9EURO|nr:hypothetical protein BDV36DRAFT_9357 [Aspergillus pseudocaelatus]
MTASGQLPEKIILVTGGSGLVGSAIQWAIDSSSSGVGNQGGGKWIFLSSADGDLRNYDETNAIFAKHKPTHVIHLAARVGGVYENSRRMADFVRDNVSIDQNVLRVCQARNVEKVVSCLSTCIFPDKTTYPITEEMLHDGPPHASNYGYAHAKRLLHILSLAYRQQYGCRFTCVIPTNLYGPNDNFSEGCHFIPGIIKRVASVMEKGEDGPRSTLVVPGSGRALRQFLYSRDLAKMLIWALWNYDAPEPLIVSPDPNQEVSIKDVVSLVSELSGFGGPIEWDTRWTDGQLRKTADNAKMRSVMKDFEFTALEQGLRETIAWYNANQGRIRGVELLEQARVSKALI